MRAGWSGKCSRRGSSRPRCRCPGRRGSSPPRRPRRCGGSSGGRAGPEPTSPCRGVRERVAEVLRDVLQRPDVEVRRGVLDDLLEIGGDRHHAAALVAAAAPAAGRRRSTRGASCPSSGCGRACRPRSRRRRTGPDSRLAVLVDHEASVLVVEDRIGEDRLPAGRRRRPGSGGACTGGKPPRRPPESASCRARRRAGRPGSRRLCPSRPRRRSPARPRRAGPANP